LKVDAIISRLEKARATGRGQWVACCPAHADKHPSMTLRETEDGRVLLHCFAGCSVEEILGAVGMTFDALFPDEKRWHRAKPLRRPFNAADVLECVALEARIVALAALDTHRGIALPETERERLLLAASRLEQARELANG
jgi:hypothetical protein